MSRLSQSFVYDVMDQFYHTNGVDPWNTDQIPSFITSNAMVAEHYAKVIAGFVSDTQEQALKIACETK